MMPLKKTSPSLRPEERTSHLHIFTQSAFTLIEQKKKSNTSLRPQGRTSRSFLHSKKKRFTSSHAEGVLHSISVHAD